MGVKTGLTIGVAALLLAAACGDEAPPDGGGADAGGTDAAAPDAGGGLDAGGSDAGGLDAAVDAGPPPPYVRQPEVEVPPLPEDPDYTGFPTDAMGRPVVIENAGFYLTPRAHDAIWAHARCTRLVLGCFEPTTRSLDACMISVPECASETPWEEGTACCAPDCVSRYEAARVGGAEPLDAFFDTFYGETRCMPGVDAILTGAAP